MIFKFNILVVLTLGLHASLCHAQIFKFLKNVDQIEISAGPSLATLVDRNFQFGKNLENKVGFAAKLSFDSKLTKGISISTAVLYERKGFKRRSTGYYYDPSKDSTNCKCTMSVGDSEFNSSRDFIEFLISPKFNLSKRFFLSSGFYMGYLVNTVTIEKYSWQGTVKYKGINPDIQRFDAGIALSLSYKLSLKSLKSIVISVNEMLGLRDISKSLTSGNKLNSFIIQVGYTLN
jgi:hypothetical protein